MAGAAGGGDERLDPNRDFYLTRGDGYYLHQSCSSLTTSRAYAWKGRPRHIKAVLAAMPKWRELTPEPVT